MNSIERKHEILKILSKQPSVEVDELTKILKVSKVTVRADLDSLETKGLLIRTHGGAMAPEHQNLIRVFTTTMTEATAEKERIAQTAATFVSNGDTVILDNGSTTVHICKYLKNKNLTVATGSLLAINELMNDESVDLLIIGGTLRRISMGGIGPLSNCCLEQIRASVLFLGASAVSSDGIWSTNLVEAETKRNMIKASSKVILVADSKKEELKGLGKIAPWSSIDYFITDSISPSLRAEIEKYDTQIILV